MRIGLIAPPWLPVPPPSYGGTEVVVDNLARGLQDLGHDVRLFTVGESTCPVHRDYLYPAGVVPIGTSIEEAAHVLAAYEALADVDIIHDHTVLGPLLAARSRAVGPPVVTTHHGPFTPENRRIYADIARHVPVVAISRSQAHQAVGVPIAAVIYHGIDLDVFTPGAGNGGHLVFVGRMSRVKGVHRAVRIAHEAGWPIVVAVTIRDRAEQDYFRQEVEPLLLASDALMLDAPLKARLDALRGAAALINPITWPEPFGLVMAEALACATPVLAFGNGAAPEIVDDSVTGFLRTDEAGLVDAVGRIDEIDRAACRAAAEQRFSLQRMARDYAAFYRRVLDTAPAPARCPVTPAPARRAVTPAPARRAVTAAPARRAVTAAPARRAVTLTRTGITTQKLASTTRSVR